MHDQALTSSPPPDLVNPVTGDRLWFEQLPATQSDALVFRCELPVASLGTPMHFHVSTDERFECVQGELAMRVGTQELRLERGSAVDVPRSTAHRFWNASKAPVVFRSRATPGSEFTKFLRAVYGLGIDGQVGRDGMPKSLLKIAVLRELSDLYFPGVPLWFQRPCFGLLSVLATTTGARASMQKYWTTTALQNRRVSEP